MTVGDSCVQQMLGCRDFTLKISSGRSVNLFKNLCWMKDSSTAFKATTLCEMGPRGLKERHLNDILCNSDLISCSRETGLETGLAG